MASTRRSWGGCRRGPRHYFSPRILRESRMAHTMTPAAYAQMVGPTVGGQARLARTDLRTGGKKDLTAHSEERGGSIVRGCAHNDGGRNGTCRGNHSHDVHARAMAHTKDA